MSLQENRRSMGIMETIRRAILTDRIRKGREGKGRKARMEWNHLHFMEKWGELGAGEGGRAGANEMKKFPVRECVWDRKKTNTTLMDGGTLPPPRDDLEETKTFY